MKSTSKRRSLDLSDCQLSVSVDFVLIAFATAEYGISRTGHLDADAPYAFDANLSMKINDSDGDVITKYA